MDLGYQLVQRLELHCPVCEQHIDGEKIKNTLIDSRLFGSVRYAVCLHCCQEVKKPWTEDYKDRWRKEAKKRAAHKIEVGFTKWLKENINLKQLTMGDYILYRSCYFEGSGAMAEWIREKILLL